MRRPHILAPNVTCRFPHQCIWLDTETVSERIGEGEERHRLVFGWAAYSVRHRGWNWTPLVWKRFSRPRDFWNWVDKVTRVRTRTYVFAHQASYDCTVVRMWDVAPRLGWKLGGLVLGSPPFIATLRNGSKTLTVIDTLNLWQKSLAKVGEHIGLPKFDRPEKWGDRKVDDAYCRRDVEILVRATQNWWGWLRDNDFGSFAVTIAGQALTTYRHRFMPHPIYLDDNEGALNLARRAYHGGRVEVGRIGSLDGPLYQLDVRSEYPYVMQAHQYPTKLLGRYRRVELTELERWLRHYSVVAEADVCVSQPVFPLHTDDRLLFPIGSFRVVLSSPELAYALAHDSLVRVTEAAVYERAPIFRDYVRALYTHKVEAERRADSFSRWCARLLLIALYGKFGQRGHHSKIIADVPIESPKTWTEYDAETGRSYRMRQVGGILQQNWTEGECRHSHPAIAAHVTAYARLYLWHLMERAGLRNVFYTDTDSLLVNETGWSALQEFTRTDGLGSLQLERVAKGGTIYGPKDYVLDEHHRHKGVRKNATWTAPDRVVQDQWLGIRSLLMREDLRAPIVIQRAKHLKRVYRKGVVLPSGRTRPFRLPDEWGRWGHKLPATG